MEYFVHLKKDKHLRKALLSPMPPLEVRSGAPIRLIQSIMGQQLSVRVAQVLHERFFKLCGRKNPSLKLISDLDPLQLRSIGLSNAKSQYVLNVARFCLDNKVTDKKLQAMESEEVIEWLTQIKGVGRWTVEMLLMFTLGRENVFAADDLGIQLAMASLYKLDRADKKQFRRQVLEISEVWSPYKTYGCMHLWAFKDNTPV